MDKNNKVLLTGVTGFLGSHIAIQLLNKGYTVIGTLRDMKRASRLKEIISGYLSSTENLSFIEADLMDNHIWKEATKGIDYVIHTASPFPKNLPKRESDLILPAKFGTLSILRAASQNRCKRVVLTSSTAAIDHGVTKHKLFDENDWSDETNLIDNSPYFRSKTIAEKAAWDYVRSGKSKLELVVINPGAMLGPVLEEDYGTSVALVKKMLDGSMPALPKMGFSLVDVRSAADMHIKALKTPNIHGQRFICVDDFLTIKGVAMILKEKFPHRKIPTRELPDFVIKLFANFDPEVKPMLSELGAKRQHTNKKAKKLLNWQPISNKRSIIDTADSLLQLNLI
ncbi:MAG: aldehyde reductase [Bacteroidota bacterium]